MLLQNPRWQDLLHQAASKCAPLPAALQQGDRANALTTQAKLRWRQALAAHVKQSGARGTPLSGRAFIELLTHLLLEQSPLEPKDATELFASYRPLVRDAATVHDALAAMGTRHGWPEASALAAQFSADARKHNSASSAHEIPFAHPGSTPRLADCLRAIRCLRQRLVDERRGPLMGLRLGRAGPRTRVMAMSRRFIYKPDAHGSLVAAVPNGGAADEAVWDAIAPILTQPMIVDYGAHLTTYAGVSPQDPNRLYAIDTEGAYVTAVMPMRFDGPAGLLLSAGEVFKSAFGSFTQGLVAIPAGLSQSIALAANWLDEVGPQFLSSGRATEELATYRFGTWLKEVAARHFPRDSRLEEDFVCHMLPAALGGMVGFLAGGWASAAVKGSATATSMVIGASGGGVTHYDAARAEGADDATSQKAFGVGVVMGMTTIPLIRVLRRIDSATGGKASQTLGAGGTKALEDFVRTWIQTAAGTVVANRIYAEERPVIEGSVDTTTTSITKTWFVRGILAGVVKAKGGAVALPATLKAPASK